MFADSQGQEAEWSDHSKTLRNITRTVWSFLGHYKLQVAKLDPIWSQAGARRVTQHRAADAANQLAPAGVQSSKAGWWWRPPADLQIISCGCVSDFLTIARGRRRNRVTRRCVSRPTGDGGPNTGDKSGLGDRRLMLRDSSRPVNHQRGCPCRTLSTLLRTSCERNALSAHMSAETIAPAEGYVV